MYSAVSATAAATSDANRLNISLEPKVDSNKLAAAAVRGAFAVALLSALLLGARPAHAQTINDLYNPPEYGDPLGTGSLAGLVADGAGNFYGTTNNGGLYQSGMVFEVSPNGSGGWNGTTIYTFGSGGADDGSEPGYGPLLLDNAGNLWGTTESGGANGYGAVFELSPAGGGNWTETTIYSFTGGTYNYDPINGLIMDSSGNLYGTTLNSSGGGVLSSGAVYELSPSDGAWTEQIIYAYPRGNRAGLTMDYAGNIYGLGSVGDQPTIYELSQNHFGEWVPTVLFTFPASSPDYGPQGTLALDKELNLYGTTFGNNKKSLGAVFELIPPNNRKSKKQWTKKVLHSFQGEATGDGAKPYAGVTLDKSGNIYGTTAFGGSGNYGAVYELFNYGDGSYGEAVLANTSDASGIAPYGAVILDSAGNVYGATAYGGSYNLGIVYEVTNN